MKYLDTEGLIYFWSKVVAYVTHQGGNYVPTTRKVNAHALSADITLTKADVGLDNVTNDAQVKRTEMGVANGVATLDSAGIVPSTQLPSYVDDVLEYASRTAFPATGETGKIYVAIDTNAVYRWGGSEYFLITDYSGVATRVSALENSMNNITAITNSEIDTITN